MSNNDMLPGTRSRLGLALRHCRNQQLCVLLSIAAVGFVSMFFGLLLFVRPALADEDCNVCDDQVDKCIEYGPCGRIISIGPCPEGSSGEGYSNDPVLYGRGAVVESATDLSVDGPLFNWSHSRRYNSMFKKSSSEADGANGFRWMVPGGHTRFVEQSDGDLVLYVDASNKRVFTKTNGSFDPPDDYDATLTVQNDGTSSETYKLVQDKTGEVFYFYGTDSAVADKRVGRLKERTNRELEAKGDTGTTYNYFTTNQESRIDYIETAYPQLRYIEFTYYSSGAEADRLKKIEVHKGGSATEVQKKVEYTYHGNLSSPSGDLGSDGDLVQVKVSRKDSDDEWVERVTQYRYNSSHQMNMVISPSQVERIIDYDANDSIDSASDILTKDDTFSVGGSVELKHFANRRFVYYSSDVDTTSVDTDFEDGEDLESTYGGTNLDETTFETDSLVKKEIINADCGSCGGSSGSDITHTFYYMNNDSSNTGTGVVERIVVQDTSDSANDGRHRRVVGLNSSNTQLRQLFYDPDENGSIWARSKKFNSNARITEKRMPSAHEGQLDTSTAKSKFFNPTESTNDSDTLNSGSGLIETYNYNADGYRKGTLVKKGSGGTAYYKSATDYGGGSTGHLPTAKYRYDTQTTTRSNGDKTSISYTFWGASGDDIKVKTITKPSVPTSENGSGASIVREEYYDQAGRLRWVKDGRGAIDYYSYHPDHGTRTYVARDVDPSNMPASASGNSNKWVDYTDDATGDGDGSYDGKPSRNTNLPTAQSLVTKTELDDDGRRRKRTKEQDEDSDRVDYFAYDGLKEFTFPSWDSSANEPRLPIQVTERNKDDQVTERYTIDPAQTSIDANDEPTGVSSNSPDHYVTWTNRNYDKVNGELKSVDEYHTIPSSGTGSLKENFYKTVYKYDGLGRRSHTIQVVSGSGASRTEQVTKRVYDIRDRVIETWKGVSNDSHDMGSNYSFDPLLKTVSTRQYDNGNAGDGHVTRTRRYYGDDAFTQTIMHRTYRGHLRGREQADGSSSSQTSVSPYMVQDINWKGQPTATANYSTEPTWPDGYSDHASTTSTDRLTLSERFYDVLGRMYQRDRHAIDSTGSSTGKVRTNIFYNENDRRVATETTGEEGREIAYDGAGRRYQTRTVTDLEATYDTNDDYQYRDPQPKPGITSGSFDMSGGNDDVIQFSHRVLDNENRPLRQIIVRANHDDTDGIDIGSSPYDHIATSIHKHYDEAGRVTSSVNYGTNDGNDDFTHASLPSHGTSAPARSDSELVTSHSYDGVTGRRTKSTDPAGIVTAFSYNDLGRRIETVRDEGGKNQRRLVQYNGLGNRTKRIADTDNDDTYANGDWNTSGDSQVTSYIYADSIHSTLVTKIEYPDSASSSDVVTKTYNRDQTIASQTDQRGTKITYTYNKRRQTKLQKVTTLGGGTDDTIRAIGKSYDDQGRVTTITSYSDTDATNAVNEVKRTYTNFQTIDKVDQDHAGTVGSGTPEVAYSYDTTDSNTDNIFDETLRPTGMTYPNGRAIDYTYTGDTVSDKINRIDAIEDGGSTLASYQHLGAGRQTVEVHQQAADTKLTYHDGDADGDYEGFDLFGRIVDHRWEDVSAASNIDRYTHGYDRASNRLYKENTQTSGEDELYSYDDLNRLTNAQRGDLDSNKDSINSKAFEQDWGLDISGNWSGFEEDDNGDGTFDLDQSREHNLVNEIDDTSGDGHAITETAGSPWADPDHDDAGNMTTVPKPTDMSSTYEATYDAWNRLVKLEDSNGVVVEYEYDGLNRRIVEEVDTNDDGTLDETRHVYYTQSWQRIEMRKGGTASGDLRKHWVWGARYIDELIQRKRDTGTDGSFDETHYALQDANFRVTATTDTTGSVVERYKYTAYGDRTVLDSDWSSDTDGDSDLDLRIGFQGRYKEDVTGLVYIRNRYYHSRLGRFISRDPMGVWYDLKGYGNGYSFVGLNPMIGLDKFGTQPSQFSVEQIRTHLEVQEKINERLQSENPKPPEKIRDCCSRDKGWAIYQGKFRTSRRKMTKWEPVTNKMYEPGGTLPTLPTLMPRFLERHKQAQQGGIKYIKHIYKITYVFHKWHVFSIWTCRINGKTKKYDSYDYTLVQEPQVESSEVIKTETMIKPPIRGRPGWNFDKVQ